MDSKRLSNRIGAGLDPCAALQTRVELAEGQEREIVFIFGAAASTEQAQQLIQQYGGRTGARLALEAHQPQDLYGGFLVGFASQFIALRFLF